MGIISTLDKMRLKFKASKQVREAADQFWRAIQHGKTFEVPIIFDGNDPSMQAVWLLFRLHPEMKMVVRQSRSFVLTHPDRLNISAETQMLMHKGGQMASPEKFAESVRSLLGGQEAFLEEQGFDPKQMEKEAQERDAAKHAMGEVAAGLDAPMPKHFCDHHRTTELVLKPGSTSERVCPVAGCPLENDVPLKDALFPALTQKFAANDVTGPTEAELAEQRAANNPAFDEAVKAFEQVSSFEPHSGSPTVDHTPDTTPSPSHD